MYFHSGLVQESPKGKTQIVLPLQTLFIELVVVSPWLLSPPKYKSIVLSSVRAIVENSALSDPVELPIFLTIYCHSGLVPESPTGKNQIAHSLQTLFSELGVASPWLLSPPKYQSIVLPSVQAQSRTSYHVEQYLLNQKTQ